MTTHNQLSDIGWLIKGKRLQHPIGGEICHWYDGKIEGVEQSAWVGSKTATVYPHGFNNEADQFGGYSLEAFCEIVVNGWPKPKLVPAARSLFGDGIDVVS